MDKPPLTTHQISRYLHVNFTTVISWCDQGRIKSYKTPGGHRRVRPEDLLEFLKAAGMPVPQVFEDRVQGPIKVLIVDDEENIRKVVRRSLLKALPGAQIHQTQDGFEAGKLAMDVLPDLIILDLMIPHVDGFKVCASIKNDPRLKDIRVLAITGQDTQENRQRILKEGADDYLPKPFGGKELMEKVGRLLDLPKD